MSAPRGWADAGVAITVIQTFDEALRRTAYDAFVERIRERVAIGGFLMTPDAAFGFERGGTPETAGGARSSRRLRCRRRPAVRSRRATGPQQRDPGGHRRRPSG